MLLCVVTYFLMTRSEFDVTILRTPGMFYQEQSDDKVSNLYDMKVVNKTFENRDVEVKLLNREGEVKILGEKKSVPGQEASLTKMFVLLDKNSITTMNTPLIFGVYAGGKEINRITTSFLGPVEKKEHHNEENEAHSRSKNEQEERH